MKQKEKTTGTQRVKLLMTTSKMNLSNASQKKIAKHIGSLDKADREQRAKEINEQLMNCKTTEEAEEIANNL